MGDVSGLHDPFAGSEVPPEIRIDSVARSHGEQTEEQDPGKGMSAV
jgi:hypothetical protein